MSVTVEGRVRIRLPSIDLDIEDGMANYRFLLSPHLTDSPERYDQWSKRTVPAGEDYKAGDEKLFYTNYSGVEAIVSLLNLAISAANTPEELATYTKEIHEWTKPFVDCQKSLDILARKVEAGPVDPFKERVQNFALQ
jgi:hypothetical protein